MTPRLTSGVAVASLFLAAVAFSGAAKAQYADPYGAPPSGQQQSVQPYQSAPPPQGQQQYAPQGQPYPAQGQPYPPQGGQPYPADPYANAPPPGPDYPYYVGGHPYCWYEAAWNGPGWYWCGYGWRRGFGWGGGPGWNGWVWRGWHGGPRGWHGGREHFRH